MKTSKEIYSASAKALIICDSLIVIFSCVFCHNLVLLLLSGIKTLICLVFCYGFACFWLKEVDIVKLYKSWFITSLLVILVHILVITICSIFSLRLASYALGLDPILLLACWVYIQRLQSEPVQLAPENPLQVQVEETLKPKKFNIEELIVASSNFSYLVGTSSYITVFRGMLPNGMLVAILQINSPKDHNSISAIVNEISNISHCKHDNIMKLLGYCLTPKFVYFVHEYMMNHRVKDWIFSKDTNRRKSLTIKQRFQVAVEVAKALDYLYNHCKNSHLDVSPTNILLNEKFKAKMISFGLWKFLGEKKKGMPGMSSNHPIVGKSLENSNNVHRYGVLLLELVSGQKHWRWCKDGEIFNILYWKLKEGKVLELVDQVLEITEEEQQKIEFLLNVALLCIQQRAEDRPSMAQVVAIMEGHEHVPFFHEISWEPMESDYYASFIPDNYSTYSDDDNIILWS